MSDSPVERVWTPSFDIDLHRTLGALGRGRLDPCQHRATDGALWRTSRMPSGAVTYRLVQNGPRTITAQTWGAGGPEFLDGLPQLLGADDQPESFVAVLPVLADAARRYPGLRVPRTGRVLEALVPAILEQKVTGVEARQSWSWLVRRYGSPAPGPTPRPMWVPPDAAGWLAVPSWDWHRSGVDPRRSATVMRACRSAGRLEQTVRLDPQAAFARLTAVEGIGVWTAAEVAQRALGDADAVSVGDYHLAGFVGYALIGEKTDDDGMLRLLEPWRGHRFRAISLLQLSPQVAAPPRRGPRLTIQDHRRW